MKYSEALDMVSNDIKKTNSFLENFPITELVSLSFVNKGITLTWCPKLKKILSSGIDHNRPLLELPVGLRLSAYKCLPGFIVFCIEKQKEMFDSEEYEIISQNLNKTFNLNNFNTKN